jgi:DNA-binding NarL/FixJ family response regulator
MAALDNATMKPGSAHEELVAVLAPDDDVPPICGALGAPPHIACFESASSLLAAQAPADLALAIVDAETITGHLQPGAEALARHLAPAPIIVICQTAERRTIRALLAAGIRGAVLRAELSSALGPCAVAVRAGQLCLPREAWREVDPPVLSMREKQVLGLVVMGYMNSQIAAQLFVAESTVKSHLSSAFGKLGVRSRYEAVERILDPDDGFGVGILSVGGEPLEGAGAPR